MDDKVREEDSLNVVRFLRFVVAHRVLNQH